MKKFENSSARQCKTVNFNDECWAIANFNVFEITLTTFIFASFRKFAVYYYIRQKRERTATVVDFYNQSQSTHLMSDCV